MVDFYKGNMGYACPTSSIEYVTRITVPAGADIKTNPIIVAQGLAFGSGISRMRIITTVALAGVTKFKVALHAHDADFQVGTQLVPNLAVADVAVPTTTAEAVVNFGSNTLAPIGTIVASTYIASGFDLFLFGDAASTNEATLIIQLTTINVASRFSQGGKTSVNETVVAAT